VKKSYSYQGEKSILNQVKKLPPTKTLCSKAGRTPKTKTFERSRGREQALKMVPSTLK